MTSLFGSQILKIFHRNDRNIKMTCRAQHLSCYVEGQIHSMTLQRNRFRTVTLLFEVGYFLKLFCQTTSLCQIPIRGALIGSTGSCLTYYN